MTQIVTVGTQALTVRSAALALRGLRDLARESNWLVKKVFGGRATSLEISRAGQVAAITPGVWHGTKRAAVYDIEAGSVPVELKANGAGQSPSAGNGSETRAAFAWSPSGVSLVGAWEEWGPRLQYFSSRGKVWAGAFGALTDLAAHARWSRDEKFLAVARGGGKKAGVSLWRADEGEVPFSGGGCAELGFPGWIERQTYEAEFGEDGAFLGYGALAFNPDGRALACVAEFQGEWADDSIAIVDVPGMREQLTHPAQGHITDLAWTPDGRQIIYCAAGQAYRLDVETMEAEALPFGAEWCACHPELPVCVCYSEWLKNSAKGRLFQVDLRTLRTTDEHAADGVAQLQWNAEGTKAYAVTRDGLAYVYEPAFL